MAKVVGVRFKEAGKIYYFNYGELDLQVGDKVIVETVRGQEFGDVVVGPKDVPEEDLAETLRSVIRRAKAKDFERIDKNKEEEERAYEICLQKIQEHKLPMKLVDVEYSFDVSKIIFYFTAEGRVDFRQLVKDLAAVFRTRIELRQIGVRDKAKMLGGIGCCGRALCCASFLGEFDPVSIRMAKDQNLSLNPSKISGVCGRLMCCLRFENDIYGSARERFPVVGSKVITPEGEAVVSGVDIVREAVEVTLKDEQRRSFALEDVQKKENTDENDRNPDKA